MSLDPCPSSPNCVCSQEDPSDAEHYIEPLDYSGTAAQALDAIAEVIGAQPRTTITSRSDDRLDAVFVSRLFRFKDDVTFLVDTDAAKLHFRSASRVGHSDLGANRKRLNLLLPQIKAKLATS